MKKRSVNLNTNKNTNHSLNLIRYGVILFLLGLITGFIIPIMQNPRMGLSSHLEGVLNGILLIVFGLIWPKLTLSEKLNKYGYSFLLFGTFANWFTVLLAGFWGAGSEMMPIASAGMSGTILQEIIIKLGLVSLSLSMIFACIIILLGLKGNHAK